MTNRIGREPIKERECSGCGGTGFMAVVQPKELGRRLFAPRCSKCEGKGKNLRQVVTYLVVDFAELKARGSRMEHLIALPEKLLSDAEDCELDR